jgi:hypothetical protein
LGLFVIFNLLKSFFDNEEEAGISLTAAYMSYPQDTAVDHKGFFTIDA